MLNVDTFSAKLLFFFFPFIVLLQVHNPFPCVMMQFKSLLVNVHGIHKHIVLLCNISLSCPSGWQGQSGSRHLIEHSSGLSAAKKGDL